ncbi:MAG: alkaline phosphatase [Firmicutes bacterium HGW-Firmicutes-1]|jgi:alkaline phosphatase|nr:MAG: alkaline phosphatase [Firmicutes bacterium HGW-Firmicutes-1]
MKKRILASVMVIMLTITSMSIVFAQEENKEVVIKNVILLVPDGTRVDSITLARWYNGGEPLAMDEFACGLVRTYNSDSPIADSAPAGSAMATGFKSKTGFIGVLPDENTMPGLKPLAKGDERRPVASVLEAAQLANKSTGLVATSEVMHATPAAFSAHYPNRGAYDILSKHMVYNEVDVVFGGGYEFMIPEGRKDDANMVTVLESKGYEVLTTKEEFDSFKGEKAWGLFADASLPYDFDNDGSVPTLEAMTDKAIDILSKDKDGFFLMVEGSKVDWASHSNDPIGIISDLLAFDKACKVALDYAKTNKDTVVIIVPDHGNGGISIGASSLDKGYDKEPLSSFLEPLKAAKLTGEGIATKLNEDRSNIVEVMATYYGITDLTDEEIAIIKEAKLSAMNVAVGPMISERAHIGWTTKGHTGEDVVLFIYSPDQDRLTGVVENTDIALYMARKLGVNLADTTKELFVPARQGFEELGAKVAWSEPVKYNPIVTVTKGDDVLELLVHTNKAIYNGKEVVLDGVIVYNGISTYVPQDALDLFQVAK